MQRSDSSTRNNWFLATPNSKKRVAQLAGGSVIASAYLVLIGWQLQLWSLKSIIPGLVTMKANTAVCFLCAGISLLLQTRQWKNNRAVQISSLSAAVVNAIAVLTICQYVFGWNLGIDELLFADPDSPATPHPGRMGINTAVNFCLVGTSLWLMSRSYPSPSKPQPRTKIDRIWFAQGLTLVAIAIALQAIVGYTYHVRVLYQTSVLTTPMALHTAICFAVLGSGILALTSHQGLMRVVTGDLLGSVVARRLIPTAIGIPLVLGWLILQGARANWYDPNFALSLMAMSMAVIWLGLIRQNAGKINRIDDDRRRSDDRLRSSEERLKLALLGAKQGIWEFDVQTQVLTWDDRCKEMFGLSPAALVTEWGHLDAIHPEDRQRVADAMELALRDCGEFAQEYRTIYPDGTTHWVLTQGCCYCNAGASYRMLGTMMDITVRKQSQLNDQFLQQLTRRLRLITDVDELQDESARSVGEYLNVDRVTWVGIDWSKRLATTDRDWYRAGLTSHAGVYAIGDFLPPALQVALFAGESVVTADVQTDLSFVPYVEAYQQLGIQANVWIPCFNENLWVATLTVNTQDARNWREDEIALLQAVAAQIWPTIEQTRAEQALRVQAEQTRAAQVIIGQQLREIEAIYQHAPIGLCFLDTDLRYVRINERLAQINGSAVTAHIGKTLRELLPELADDVEPIYLQVIETGEPIVDLEVSGTNPAQPGVIRSWISSFYPQTDAEHRVIGVNTVVQEITEQQAALRERQQTEAALRVSERKFSAIFNQTFGLIGLLDVNGVVLEVNQAALDSLVQPTPWRIYARASEIVGTELWQTPWWKYFPPLQQQLRAALERAKGGEFIRYEVEFPYQIGTSKPTIDFSIKPVFNERGEVATLIVEGRDITEQQAALRERVQAQVALEQRTQELDRAVAVLRDRNQELDSFVYVVSHDLKAPLRAISNLSQWIEEDLDGVLSPQIQQHTVLLRNRIQRMEATIDGLLDYARIGRSTGKIELVAIADLLMDAIDSIAPPPTFNIVIAPDLPTLHTNRLFLSQVFVNLIGNGIKHHDRVDGSIVISSQECGDFYRFEVTDDGPGIDPEQHERVFEIFKALNPQNRSDSTGIGLAIVKKIIEAEGGTIRLNSQLGQGTTFSFTWPKRSALAVESQQAS